MQSPTDEPEHRVPPPDAACRQFYAPDPMVTPLHVGQLVRDYAAIHSRIVAKTFGPQQTQFHETQNEWCRNFPRDKDRKSPD